MNFYSILFGLFFVTALMNNTVAQEQPSLRKRANDLYERLAYAEALPLYHRLVNVKKPKVVDIEKIAHAHLYLKQYEQAENWFARAVQTAGHSKEALMGYAEALKQQGKYAEAKQQFQEYSNQNGKTEKLQLALDGCDSAVVWMTNPQRYTLKNEQHINTDLAEFGAIPYAQGLLYAAEPKVGNAKVSSMTGEGYIKLFSAHKEGEALTMPAILSSDINQATYHVGPVLPSKTGDVLYVTRTNASHAIEVVKMRGGKRLHQYNLELIIYKKVGADWQAEDFAYNNTKAYSVGHAALSADEKTLYFASDMPGGQGGVDIWFSELQSDGSWGKPINAGTEVNSAGDEMFPTVVGNKLYYASDGFPGMGGLDIFVVEGAKGQFKQRKNMQYPLNSASDDFAYVLTASDGQGNSAGYLSSNRVGGVGSDDIYSFHYAKPKVQLWLEGTTYDKKTQKQLAQASVNLVASNGAIIARKTSDDKGAFGFALEAGMTYRVEAAHSGYMSDSTRLVTTFPQKDTTMRIALYLAPLYKVGDKIILENIYYNFDAFDIRTDAALSLDHLVRVMRDNPTMRIELSSHTDSRGSDAYNMKLSQRRAEAAVGYVVSRGIDRSRLVPKGYGETRLVNACSNGVDCTPAEHQANRRTEVEVIAF